MTRDPLGIRDRVVVVVGAGGGGIGTSICARLAAEGARVVAVDRDAEALDAVERTVRARGAECTGIVADAGDRAALDAMVERARETCGPIFGLVNVVGGLPRERWDPVLDCSEEGFDAVFAGNVRCAFLASQAVGRQLARQRSGGSVVQLASIAALQGMPFGAPYAAAKASLISLTRTMALEWGRLGVRVNAVAPGSVRVPRSDAPDDPERDRATLPLGRRGAPEDVAGAALFLLSELSAWITGQVLVVDGGASIKPSYIDDSGLPVFVEDPALRERLTGRDPGGSTGG